MSRNREDSSGAIGRTMPHSIEAEEYLLSCCLLDGHQTVAKCQQNNVTPEAFYSPANRLIFKTMLGIYERGGLVDIAVLAEELKAKRQLEEIGGYHYLTQVSGRIPTTAQAQYFIDKIMELYTRREAVKLSTSAVEKVFLGEDDVADVLSDLEQRISQLRATHTPSESATPLTAFELPPETDDTSLLGQNRYICRGDGALVVSSSGMGKSSMNYEWAARTALGMPFLGIITREPLTSLIIQAEDSPGDVGEVWFSVKHSLNLTPEQVAQVEKRVIVVRDKINRGDAFIANLRVLVERHKPDLVWLNPLHAFAGCDISDAKELGKFLREGLNKANRHDRFAYMIVHHTPKPVSSKNVAEKRWHEFMYDAAGSAELVNWARAVITLKPAEQEGEFNMILAKRGKRAGVMIEVKGECSNHLEVTTKIPCRHSTQKITIEGRKHPFQIIAWEARDPDPTAGANKKNKGQFDPKYSDADILTYIPAAASDDPIPFAQLYSDLQQGKGMSKATLTRRLVKMRMDKLVTQTDDRRYKRTEEGDREAEAFLKTVA